jgi:hypothetical protein
MLRFYHSLHANTIPRRIPIRFIKHSGPVLKSWQNYHSPTDEVGSQVSPDPVQDEAFQAYCAANSLAEDTGIESVPANPSELALVLPRAQELRASSIVRSIANCYLRLPEQEDALGHALLTSDTYVKLLARSQAIDVFNKLLAHPHNLEYMSTNILIYLGHALITDPGSNMLGMDSIVSTLLQRWSGQDAIGHEGHFRGTWVIFQLLRAIMKVSPEKGQRHFRAMLKSKTWWPEGSTDIVEAIEDPATIVAMFILRCCISWRWWDRAYGIAHDLAQPTAAVATTAEPIQAALVNLMVSHMDASGILIDIRPCAALICTMVDQPSFPPMQNALLQRFYKACADASIPRPEVANSVYLYLRDKQSLPEEFPLQIPDGGADVSVDRKKALHTYHPPQGRRILSLLDLYHRKNDHNAASLLISDIQKRLDTIPSDILAPYLIFIIKLSFATEARAVWTMCLNSEDSDKGAITILPSVSRHLVSLFVSMAEASYQRSISRSKKQRYYAQKAEELMEFAWTVARRYRKSVLPLEKWEHHRLTTLARICFAIGNYNGGFDAMKMIIKREDILPDAYDTSVVLHLLASADPQAAVDHLDYMISRGVEPESSAYGIVAAQCLKHGKFKLAGEILNTSKKRGRGNWDSKVLGAICWHNITREALKDASREEIVARLKMVLEQLGPGGGVREAVFRERTLGVRAANVALDIHRPDLALKFWTRCIQFKTIARKSNEKNIDFHRDQERVLRARILRESENSTVVSWNLPQGVAEALRAPSRAKPIKRQDKAFDDQKIPA